MICSCPKCNNQIALDPTDIQPEGSFNKCSACGTSFVVRKESFARRALHKSTEISCAECGNPPGSSIYCSSCHAIYPDFLAIETSSPAKRQLGQLLKTLNALKNLKLGGSANPSADSYSDLPLKAGKAKDLHSPRRSAKLLAALVILILFFGGGGYYWYQDRLATNYTRNYVKALLGIKLARDLNIKLSNRLTAEMKAGTSASLTATEQKSAASAKKDVDSLMERLGKIPDKFTPNNDSLKKLYGSYAKLHTTVTSPPGPSDIYAASINTIDDDFKKAAKELKSGLPEKISTQLSATSKKFTALQDL